MSKTIVSKAIILICLALHLFLAIVSTTIQIIDAKIIIEVLVFIVQIILVLIPVAVVYKFKVYEFRFLTVITIAFTFTGLVFIIDSIYIFALLPYLLTLIFFTKKAHFGYKIAILIPLILLTCFIGLKILFVFSEFSVAYEGDIYLSPDTNNAVVINIIDQGALGADTIVYIDSNIHDLYKVRRRLLIGIDNIEVDWITNQSVLINDKLYNLNRQKWVVN